MANSSAASVSCGRPTRSGASASARRGSPIPNSSAARVSCGSGIPSGSGGTRGGGEVIRVGVLHVPMVPRIMDPVNPDRARGGGLPPPRAAFARAHGRAEHRADGAGRLLPQLPVALVPGGRRGAGRRHSGPEAREIVYGMPYEEWKARFQSEPPPADRPRPASGPPPQRLRGGQREGGGGRGPRADARGRRARRARPLTRQAAPSRERSRRARGAARGRLRRGRTRVRERRPAEPRAPSRTPRCRAELREARAALTTSAAT